MVTRRDVLTGAAAVGAAAVVPFAAFAETPAVEPAVAPNMTATEVSRRIAEHLERMERDARAGRPVFWNSEIGRMIAKAQSDLATYGHATIDVSAAVAAYRGG